MECYRRGIEWEKDWAIEGPALLPGSLRLLFEHTVPHTVLTSDRAWLKELKGGEFEAWGAYLHCMWTENRKTGGL